MVKLDLAEKKLTTVASYSEKPHILRLSPKDDSRYAVGGVDGTIQFRDTRANTAVKAKHPDEIPLEDGHWHPAEDYFIACYRDGSMKLFESFRNTASFAFERQGMGIRAVRWAYDMSGDLLTCSLKVGTFKVWNASQKAPKKTIKVWTQGIRTFEGIVGSSELYVVVFKNCSLGLFNMKKRKVVWSIEAGHSETIFDIKFHPANTSLLATASYDGYIKVWDIATMKLAQNFSTQANMVSPLGEKHSLVVYGISWSPKDGSRLVSAHNNGEVIMWDAAKGKVLSKIRSEACKQIYRVDWNTQSEDLIAFGSTEGICYIVRIKNKSDMEFYKKLVHEATVYGVMWCPWNKNMLATGCQDTLVRLFDFSKGDVPVHTFRGHKGPVFNVLWHPHFDYILASGSDDGTVRVWDANTVSVA